MANRILLTERRRKCYYCSTPMIRVVDEPNNIPGPVSKLKIPLDLKSTLNDAGYQRDDFVALCKRCGYWMGHGTREMMHGPNMARLIEGYVQRFDISSLDTPTEALVDHLAKNPGDLLYIDPFKAEDVVCNLLRDHLHCDVRKVGGRRDGGIDAYLVEAETVTTVVQVKWRRDNHGGEGVRVVRELIGTMIDAGIPNGFLVTTKDHMTKSALDYARTVETSPLTTRMLKLEYRCYDDLISMLDLKSSDRMGFMTLPESILRYSAGQSFCIFD